MFNHPGVIRGYHVYGNTENWKPYVGEYIAFRQEHANPHDRFAVIGQSDINGRVAITVGHVPREISRHIWYALHYGAVITARVTDPTPKWSPLVQGGLEISLEMTISWDDFGKTEILRKKLNSVSFGDYTDDSVDILTEMGVDVIGNESESDNNDNDTGDQPSSSISSAEIFTEMGVDVETESESDDNENDTRDQPSNIDYSSSSESDDDHDQEINSVSNSEDISRPNKSRRIVMISDSSDSSEDA